MIDLKVRNLNVSIFLYIDPRLCIGVDKVTMTLESLSKEKESGLTRKELKALKDIDSGKVKMTRYKNVYDYLKHLDKAHKK